MTGRADGFTLADRLHHPAPLSPVEVAVVGGQLAGALDGWHRGGASHRALDPAHVEVTREPDGRLLARLLAADGAATDPHYLAPEQLSGRPVGPAADVYALGVVLLDCLLGRQVSPPVVPDDLGAAWRYLLGGMVATSAADRPTARTVADTLAAVPGVAPAPAVATPAPARARAAGAPRSKLLPAGVHVEPVPIELPKESRFAKLLPPIPGRRRPQEPDVRQQVDGG